jgi:hypothetical protein
MRVAAAAGPSVTAVGRKAHLHVCRLRCAVLVGCKAGGVHGLLKGFDEAQGENDVSLAKHACRTSRLHRVSNGAGAGVAVWAPALANTASWELRPDPMRASQAPCAT